MRRLLVLAAGAAFLLASTASFASFAAPPATSAPPFTPRVGHVWIFVFENTNYAGVTAESMPYLTTQAQHGVTLSKMYGVGHVSLDNYIAMVSGHEPNAKTKSDCFNYDCVYPAGDDSNVADQLESAGFTWKGYMDGATRPCQHSVEGKGEKYLVGYATRHDPFVYYRSIVGDTARCNAHVVPYPQLATDLAAGNVPNYSFVTPDTCHDAHDGSRKGCSLHDADTWLSTALPPILASDAYKTGGAVILTFDEADSDNTGCCGSGGGGHIATAIVSPRLAHPGTVDATPSSHYSMLRTIEDDFGLPCLRHACDASTKSWIDQFQPAPGPTPQTTLAPADTTTTPVTPTGRPVLVHNDSGHTGLVVVLVVVGVVVLGLAGLALRSRRRREP